MHFIKTCYILAICLLVNISCFTVQAQDKVKQQIDQWYKDIGFNGRVSPLDFETAVRGYFYYLKKGKISSSNLIVIAELATIHATKDRFFVVQIGNSAHIEYAGLVTHARASDHGGHAATFSNTPGSKTSSRGFMVTTNERYSGNYGKSLRIRGLEPQVNGNVYSRAIVIHPLRDMEKPNIIGFSAGCLAMPLSYSQEVINLIAGSTLIYVSDGKTHNYTFMGGDGSVTEEDINGIPNTSHSSSSTSEPRELSSAIDPLSGQTTGTYTQSGFDIGSMLPPSLAGLDGTLTKEDFKDPFSDELSNESVGPTQSYQECLNRLQSTASPKSVIEATKIPGGDPSKYFKATYTDIVKKAETTGEAQSPDGDLKHALTENKIKNDECIAVFSVQDSSSFSNDSYETKSSDERIECTKSSGSECVDCVACEELLDVHEKTLVKIDEFETSQVDENKSRHAEQSSSLGTTLYNKSSLAAQDLAGDDSNTSSQQLIDRARLYDESADELDRLQQNLPNRDSLMAECNSFQATNSDQGADYLKGFVNILDIPDKSISTLPDPCSAMTSMNLNLVQNRKAKQQTIDVVGSMREKAQELRDKSATLSGQGDFAKNMARNNLNSSGSNVSANSATGSSAKEQLTNAKMKHLDPTEKGGFYTDNGHSKGLLKTKNTSSKKTLWDDISKQYPNQKLVFNSGKGVYKKNFYANIKLALKGRYPLDKLTTNQKYEYNRIVRKLRKAQAHRKGKTETDSTSLLSLSLNDQKRTNKLSREIWFNKKLSIFDIISNRYVDKFSEDFKQQ